jgi:Arc/MetJ family transcription regulator
MPTLKNARLLAAAAVAGVALGVAATSFAQDAHAPTDAQVAEHEAMVTAVMKAVLVETDFEAVKAHMTAAIREHAEEIGGDTEATVTHVTEFLDRVAEHAASDPQGAAEFTATMLIEAHRPH